MVIDRKANGVVNNNGIESGEIRPEPAAIYAGHSASSRQEITIMTRVFAKSLQVFENSSNMSRPIIVENDHVQFFHALLPYRTCKLSQ